MAAIDEFLGLVQKAQRARTNSGDAAALGLTTELIRERFGVSDAVAKALAADVLAGDPTSFEKMRGRVEIPAGETITLPSGSTVANVDFTNTSSAQAPILTLGTTTRAFEKSDAHSGISVLNKDGGVWIYGPGSVAIVDRENDIITGPALREALPQLLLRARLSLQHLDVLVGEIVSSADVGGRVYKTEVRPVTAQDIAEFPLLKANAKEGDEALWVLGKLYSDNKFSQEVVERVLKGELGCYSISGQAVSESKKIDCSGYSCKFVNTIERVALSACTICAVGMNQSSGFRVIAKAGEKEGVFTLLSKEAAEALAKSEEDCNCGGDCCKDKLVKEVPPKDAEEKKLPLGTPVYPKGPTVYARPSEDAGTKPPKEDEEYYDKPDHSEDAKIPVTEESQDSSYLQRALENAVRDLAIHEMIAKLDHAEDDPAKYIIDANGEVKHRDEIKEADDAVLAEIGELKELLSQFMAAPQPEPIASPEDDFPMGVPGDVAPTPAPDVEDVSPVEDSPPVASDAPPTEEAPVKETPVEEDVEEKAKPRLQMVHEKKRDDATFKALHEALDAIGREPNWAEQLLAKLEKSWVPHPTASGKVAARNTVSGDVRYGEEAERLLSGGASRAAGAADMGAMFDPSTSNLRGGPPKYNDPSETAPGRAAQNRALDRNAKPDPQPALGVASAPAQVATEAGYKPGTQSHQDVADITANRARSDDAMRSAGVDMSSSPEDQLRQYNATRSKPEPKPTIMPGEEGAYEIPESSRTREMQGLTGQRQAQLEDIASKVPTREEFQSAVKELRALMSRGNNMTPQEGQRLGEILTLTRGHGLGGTVPPYEQIYQGREPTEEKAGPKPQLGPNPPNRVPGHRATEAYRHAEATGHNPIRAEGEAHKRMRTYDKKPPALGAAAALEEKANPVARERDAVAGSEFAITTPRGVNAGTHGGRASGDREARHTAQGRAYRTSKPKPADYSAASRLKALNARMDDLLTKDAKLAVIHRILDQLEGQVEQAEQQIVEELDAEIPGHIEDAAPRPVMDQYRTQARVAAYDQGSLAPGAYGKSPNGDMKQETVEDFDIIQKPDEEVSPDAPPMGAQPPEQIPPPGDPLAGNPGDATMDAQSGTGAVESGPADAGQALVASVYEDCRGTCDDKTQCARTAWEAAKSAGYEPTLKSLKHSNRFREVEDLAKSLGLESPHKLANVIAGTEIVAFCKDCDNGRRKYDAVDSFFAVVRKAVAGEAKNTSRLSALDHFAFKKEYPVLERACNVLLRSSK